MSMRLRPPLRAAMLALVIALACERHEPPPLAEPASAEARSQAELQFVGTERCSGCHAQETEAWRGSHHAAAMQRTDVRAPLGDFSNAELMAGGVASRFLRRDGRFLVATEAPDGATREYEALYTFGIDPLQQLLLPLDRGRLQATTMAWDARSKPEGGQRWFALHGDERIGPDDVLHWSGPAQRWNAMCAECHSTNVCKGYRVEEDRYETTSSEISVGCEACHGPGARHVGWAEASARGDARGADPGLPAPLAGDAATWRFADGAPIAQRSAPQRSHAEIDVCAPCHARRAVIADPEYGKPLFDTHRPALLDADLYAADGQIQGEVYEWGSFLQSRMHAMGVTCSDCHEPHGARLRAEGNAVCAQCHRTEVFDTPAHHHHAAGTAPARCTACHMPTRLYMVIDARHDHSLRVPRPDLSTALGTPNACNACHVERPARWAADAVARWYGESRRREPHFGETLAAARSAAVGAERALAALANDAKQPAIARATALQELAAWPGPDSRSALERAALDPDPLLRLGAVSGARGADPAERLALLAPLLRDPLRAVRIEAARALVEVAPDQWPPGKRNDLIEPLAEWRSAQHVNADQPGAHVALGALHAQLGELAPARAEYEIALRLGPWYVPAYLNLADLHRAEGRDDEAAPLLQRALVLAPDSADAHHALGLLLVRRREMNAAVEELRRASELAPDDARYAYVYAVALYSGGDSARAVASLEAFRARRPGDPQLAAWIEQLRRTPAP